MNAKLIFAVSALSGAVITGVGMKIAHSTGKVRALNKLRNIQLDNLKADYIEASGNELGETFNDRLTLDYELDVDRINEIYDDLIAEL